MSDSTDFIERVMDEDGRTDVTDEYEDIIEMFIGLAHNRTVPIPLEHVVAYSDEHRPQTVVFVFLIDTNEDVIDDTYGFEVAVKEHVIDHMTSDDGEPATDDTEPMSDMVLDQYTRQLRVVQETIWENVVNLDYE